MKEEVNSRLGARCKKPTLTWLDISYLGLLRGGLPFVCEDIGSSHRPVVAGSIVMFGGGERAVVIRGVW